MSRLWAGTFIILALGLGLMIGVLVVTFLVVLPRGEPSQLSGLLEITNTLKKAGGDEVNWEVNDPGSILWYFGRSDRISRRFQAEGVMAQELQATFVSGIQAEILRQIRQHGGTSQSMAATRSGMKTEHGRNLQFLRHSFTESYRIKDRRGYVHATCIGEGDRLIVTLILYEE